MKCFKNTVFHFVNSTIFLSRLVSSLSRRNSKTSTSSTQHGASFAVRVGTIDGVITHNLRAVTRRDLAAWARAIVQGCHMAALTLQEYTVRKYVNWEIIFTGVHFFHKTTFLYLSLSMHSSLKIFAFPVATYPELPVRHFIINRTLSTFI